MCQPTPSVESPVKPVKGYRAITVRGLTKDHLSRLKERARNVDMSMEAYVRSLITEDDRNHALIEFAEEISEQYPSFAKRIMSIVEGDNGSKEAQAEA